MKIILVVVLFLVGSIVFLGITSEDATPSPLNPANSDPQAAFPQHQRVYRNEGKLMKKRNFVYYDFYRFLDNGVVTRTTRSFTSNGQMNKELLKEVDDELSENGRGKFRQLGKYKVTAGTIQFYLHRANHRFIFEGKIDGDQIVVSSKTASGIGLSPRERIGLALAEAR